MSKWIKQLWHSVFGLRSKKVHSDSDGPVAVTKEIFDRTVEDIVRGRGAKLPKKGWSGNAVPISPEVMKRTAVDIVMHPPVFPTFFKQAVAVSDKLARRFEGKPWLIYVAVEPDEEHGYAVHLGIDPQVLALKPDELQYFHFSQMVDEVKVYIRAMKGGVTLETKV